MVRVNPCVCVELPRAHHRKMLVLDRDEISPDDAAAVIHSVGHPDVYRFLVVNQLGRRALAALGQAKRSRRRCSRPPTMMALAALRRQAPQRFRV